jgi:hypothetical protein
VASIDHFLCGLGSVDIKHLEAVHAATHPGASLPGRRRPTRVLALDAEARRDEPDRG